MTKWADFCISAVQYDAEHKHIVKAAVRVDDGEKIGPPEEKLRARIAADIILGKTYTTIVRSESKWVKGQPVKVVTINGTRYIKTVEDSDESDNLENLPEL